MNKLIKPWNIEACVNLAKLSSPVLDCLTQTPKLPSSALLSSVGQSTPTSLYALGLTRARAWAPCMPCAVARTLCLLLNGGAHTHAQWYILKALPSKREEVPCSPFCALQLLKIRSATRHSINLIQSRHIHTIHFHTSFVPHCVASEKFTEQTWINRALHLHHQIYAISQIVHIHAYSH